MGLLDSTFIYDDEFNPLREFFVGPTTPWISFRPMVTIGPYLGHSLTTNVGHNPSLLTGLGPIVGDHLSELRCGQVWPKPPTQPVSWTA